MMTNEDDDRLLEQYSRLQPLAGKGPHLALYYGLPVLDVEWLTDGVLANADDKARAALPADEIPEARIALTRFETAKINLYSALPDALDGIKELTLAVCQVTPEGVERLFSAVWPLLQSGGVICCNHYRTTRRHKRWECCYAIDAYLESLQPHSFTWLWKDTQCGIRKT